VPIASTSTHATAQSPASSEGPSTSEEFNNTPNTAVTHSQVDKDLFEADTNKRKQPATGSDSEQEPTPENHSNAKKRKTSDERGVFSGE
jgi:hypothetical protein